MSDITEHPDPSDTVVRLRHLADVAATYGHARLSATTAKQSADLIESQAAGLSRLREERDALRARTDGAALIAAERQRQLSDEGWTPEHDAEWVNGELASAAICYARSVVDGYVTPFLANAPIGWPWHEDWYKPSDDSIRNLVKAGALIAAEIDRLQRAAS